jgi:hypothetical protein
MKKKGEATYVHIYLLLQLATYLSYEACELIMITKIEVKQNIEIFE